MPESTPHPSQQKRKRIKFEKSKYLLPELKKRLKRLSTKQS
jgi:hypothetical protein